MQKKNRVLFRDGDRKNQFSLDNPWGKFYDSER